MTAQERLALAAKAELPALPELRAFKVTRSSPPFTETIYAHGFDVAYCGSVGFFVFAYEGEQLVQFVRRSFRFWEDVEELLLPRVDGKAN